jgi:hypothetical protein
MSVSRPLSIAKASGCIRYPLLVRNESALDISLFNWFTGIIFYIVINLIVDINKQYFKVK